LAKNINNPILVDIQDYMHWIPSSLWTITLKATTLSSIPYALAQHKNASNQASSTMARP